MEGELRDQQFVRALRSIGRRRKTGILTVQGRDEIIAFSFAEGGIVGADALNQSLEEGLGDVLARQQLVDPAEFAALAAEHESGGGRVVDLLVERSFLSRGQLLDCLRLHTYRLCLEALSWSSGEYRFYQGDEVAFEVGVEAIGVGELLVRSSLELGGAGPLPLPIPDLDEIYRRAGSDSSATPGDTSEAGSVSASHRVLELLDGKRTLREIAASSDFSPFEVRDLASEWQEAGLIERVGERASYGEPDLVVENLAVPSVLPSIESDKGPALTPAIDLGIEVEETPPPVPIPVPRPAADEGVQSRAPDLRWVSVAGRWLHRLAAIGILMAALGLLATVPARVLSPFPWQRSVLDHLSGQQQTVKRLNVERGAHAFFLLHGRYPETLEELVSGGFTGPEQIDLGRGRSWRLTVSPSSLVLRMPEMEGPGDAGWASSVEGDFLLDPEFFQPAPTTEGPLLVLLD